MTKTYFFYECNICGNIVMLLRRVQITLKCPYCGRETLKGGEVHETHEGYNTIAEGIVDQLYKEQKAKRESMVISRPEPFRPSEEQLQDERLSPEEIDRYRKTTMQRERRKTTKKQPNAPGKNCRYCGEYFDNRGIQLHEARCFGNPNKIPMATGGRIPPRKNATRNDQPIQATDPGTETKNEPITAQSFSEFASKMEKARDNTLTFKQ